MFVTLVLKEIKMHLKSFTFWILFIIIGLNYFTQFDPNNIELPYEPQKEEAQTEKSTFYGMTYETDNEKKIKGVFLQMLSDYGYGKYLQYKIIGNYVKLNEKKKQAILDAMEKIAPGYLDFSQLDMDKINEDYKTIINKAREKGDMDFSKEYTYDIHVMNKKVRFIEEKVESSFKPDISYEKYEEIVRELDRKLGGGTMYGDKYRDSLVSRPKTFDEALKDYNNLVSKDKVTNAFARYFADYMGIIGGFLPIFMSGFILLRDKKNKMNDIVNSRVIPSWVYIGAKYVALCGVIMFCFVIYATHATLIFNRLSVINDVAIDILAFYKYTFFWLLPTVLFTVSLGFLVCAVFNFGVIAIPVQLILWYSSLMPLIGDYGLSKIIIRFNSIFDYDLYMRSLSSITINRIFYIILSLAFLLITIFIWSRRRGGKNDFKEILGFGAL